MLRSKEGVPALRLYEIVSGTEKENPQVRDLEIDLKLVAECGVRVNASRVALTLRPLQLPQRTGPDRRHVLPSHPARCVEGSSPYHWHY